MNETKWLMNYLDERELIPEMDRCINVIRNWTLMNHKYESKNARIAEWNPTDADIYGVLCHILIGCFINREMTYQAMIGYIVNDINCVDQIDRIKTAAELIAIAYQCDLIIISKRSDSMYITTEFELDEDIPEFKKHAPESRPYVAVTNQILGCRFKQHSEDTCLSHINTMNKVALQLNWRVIDEMAEYPKKEELIDTEEWKDFSRRSRRMYESTGTDKFYLKHNFDARGRSYCKGYFITYQGSSYKKAIIELAHKELI
jgi:hypothetical protein